MSSKLKSALLLTIFILGYTSLSFELIILRQFINFVGSNALITSIIMSFVLGFLSLGYYIGSTVSFAKYSIRRLCLKVIYILALWCVLACSYIFISIIFYELISNNITSTLVQVFIISALLLIVPSIGLGFVTSVIGRIIHHFNYGYTGRFMAVDTIGGVLGSLVTTLILMPMLGVYAASVAIVFLTMLTAVLISNKHKIMKNMFACLLITFLAFSVLNETYVLGNKNLLLDNAAARVEVFDMDIKDNVPQSKVMYVNNGNSSKISKDKKLLFPYVDFINTNFIANLPQDKKYNILILGAAGFTIGLEDERNNYIYVDIIKPIQEISEKYFLGKPLSANKKFVFQDAYLYMLKNDIKFDIIIVDLYSTIHNIPEQFVTVDFFEMVKQNLANDGIMIANIITSASFKNNLSRRVDNTLRAVYGNSLSRQVTGDFNPFNNKKDNLSNVVYVFYNGNDDNSIYTVNKNSAVFGQ